MSPDKNIKFDLSPLHDHNPETVLKALQGLNSAGPEAAYSAIQPLIGLLDYPDSQVRSQAAQVLGRLEKVEPGVIEALIEATFDRDSGVKRSAIGSLGELGREERNPDIIERLLELTFDKDERVREKAAFVLGSLELREPAIVNRLADLLRDRDTTVKGTAIDALAKVGNKSHIPLLKKFINSEPVYDIYDSNLVTKAKNAFEQVWNREP